MADIKEALQECEEICNKYERVIGGYASGELYLQFCDEVINMVFLVASCDGKVDNAEISTINNTFNMMLNYEMLARRYGTDYLTEDSFLQKVPDVIRKVALAEKQENFGGKCFLIDTRKLCKFMEQFGNVMIHCCGARLKFAVTLLEFFVNGILEHICIVENEEAQSEELKELQHNRTEDKNTLFSRNDVENIDEINAVLAEVDALVGLTNVKKEIHDMVNLLIVQKMREKNGLKSTNISRHLVFTGNPGTGKTTIARMMARIFKHLDILGSGQLVETDRSMLVSSQMGETAENVRRIAESAMGGVLFIDEAYALLSDVEGDYGQEAIETLLKIMEDHRDKLVVIVAGYTDLMDKFLDSNPGLRSRFSKFIQFADYSEVELLQIFELFCKEQDYCLAEGTESIILEKIRNMKTINMEHFGNARTLRNYFERVISNQANRIVEEMGMGISNGPADLTTITGKDL
ncbi:MAG: AAA family ATPase [Lachnospiraceae bacterium]|nr:AAA family ATPase [Lachnospiraceae bacterium]